MSRQLINEYRSDLDRIIKVGGSLNEGSVRDAFQSLLKSWGRSNDLTYLSEHKMTGSGGSIYIDGALVYDIRVPFGYWEAKDTKDDLEEEIRKKEAKGYPKTNIIYEDTRRAILIQDGKRTAEADMKDTEELYSLLTTFFGYEQAAIRDFRKAIAKFAEDLPAILEALRDRIREKREASTDFAKAEEAFLKQVKETINPALERADVTEMLIQHILTEDIFNRVFDMRDYHRDNNIAKQLYALERKLFEYGDKRTLLQALRPYYTGIEETAHLIQSHSEKQNFLKSLYENFYKVYNPKAADRLGVVYTPGEIVRFMIRSTDWLCEKHFGKNLVDPGVEILDPATGTGTYIVELLEYFRGQPDKLRHKYKEELHANEVAILPYYVANLNIEASYQAITGQFAEFEGLCLVDTLDNTEPLVEQKNTHVGDLFGALSDENAERIKAQNEKPISVVIGNPPYNAHQDRIDIDDPNRNYPVVDEMIRLSFVEAGSAELNVNYYDMYVRFLKWASKRVRDNGVVTFVTNSSFIHKNSLDGIRAKLAEDFSEIWILDLKGDARTSGEARRKEGGNVFGDQIRVGVAVYALVKRTAEDQKFTIYFDEVDDYAKADEKRTFLNRHFGEREMEVHFPNAEHDWIEHRLQNEDIALIADSTREVEIDGQARAIFKDFALGISTNRDAWVYDRDEEALSKKIQFFLNHYEAVSPHTREFGKIIKWSERLQNRKRAGKSELFDPTKITTGLYRPFTKRALYQSDLLIDRGRAAEDFFPPDCDNRALSITDMGGRTLFCVQATSQAADLHFGAAVDGYQQIPRFRFDVDGHAIDNITDWALNKFTKHYGNKAGITKDAIFAYCYATLYDPVYREKYALNLKREFPRIPFYPHFAQWAAWGEALLDLHINYEDVEPYPLERIDTPNPKRAAGSPPKPKLKSVLAEGAETGSVVVDEDTQIIGIPTVAWDYRLGNRSAIDWVLDQHKEKKPRDPTIAAKFNTYRFADYKESMIELLAKVVRVSVETNAITDEMTELDRSGWDDSGSE